MVTTTRQRTAFFNALSPELNPICYLLALLAHHFLNVSRIRVKSLTLRLLMSYIYIYIHMTLVTYGLTSFALITQYRSQGCHKLQTTWEHFIFYIKEKITLLTLAILSLFPTRYTILFRLYTVSGFPLSSTCSQWYSPPLQRGRVPLAAYTI
jgi:hypothetical protein